LKLACGALIFGGWARQLCSQPQDQGPERRGDRLVYGVASLPLGTPVELEIIFEVGP